VTAPIIDPKINTTTGSYGIYHHQTAIVANSADKLLSNLAKKLEVAATNSLEIMEQEAVMDTQVASTKIACTMEQIMVLKSLKKLSYLKLPWKDLLVGANHANLQTESSYIGTVSRQDGVLVVALLMIEISL
jgi:hypothetical protein